MRRRYQLNDEGVYVDRNGLPAPQWGIGKLMSFSLELTPAEAHAASVGTIGVVSTATSNDKSKDEKDKDTPISPQSQRSAVWEHYVQVQQPRSKQLRKEEAFLIDAALKVATVVELKRAIDGNKASPFHQGHNDRQRKYNSIAHIFRPRKGETTRQRIDWYIDRAEEAGLTGSEGGVRSADAYTVGVHKRYVLDAEGSDDEVVRQRGEEGEAWLKEQGWLVVRDGGKVRFETA